MKNKNEQKFKEKSFYAYKFFNDCLPVYALYTILFREKGLSVAEIALLLSFWSFVVLVAELPSAILADRWNRKYMLCIATFLKTACFITWCFSETFVMFGLGFVFWGIENAFCSGTEEGLIYDNLKSENKEKEFTKIYGKGRFYATLGVLIAIISSGILATFISISAISILSVVLCVISFMFVCQLREKNYYSERLKKEKIGYFNTFLEAAKLCIKNSKILISMIFLVFIVSIIDYSDEYDALIIDDFQLGYIWISVIYTVRLLFVAIGNHIAPKIEKKYTSKNKTFILAIIASLLLFTFSMLWNQYAILVLGIGCMIMTIADVLQINLIQREIKEEGRATVMSIYSIGQNTVMIIFCLIYALLSGFYTLKTVYVIISIYCIAGAVLLYFINPKLNKVKNYSPIKF